MECYVGLDVHSKASVLVIQDGLRAPRDGAGRRGEAPAPSVAAAVSVRKRSR